MLTLTQGRRQNVGAGEPLYSPFQVMKSSETHIRKGQFSLIAAGPGTGKSAWIQAMLQRGDDNGNHNSVFYFSADSDQDTMFKRAAAIATGYEQTDVERMIRDGRIGPLEEEVNASTSHMWFDYRSNPSEEDVLTEIEAYLTVYGAYPEVVVVDNLKNLYVDGVTGEFEVLEAACMFLQGIARDTNAAVIALHHVIGASEDGDKPIPMSGIRGKVTKTPEVVLTMHRTGDYLNVSPVKNRNGRADASGNWFRPIQCDMARMAYTG